MLEQTFLSSLIWFLLLDRTELALGLVDQRRSLGVGGRMSAQHEFLREKLGHGRVDAPDPIEHQVAQGALDLDERSRCARQRVGVGHDHDPGPPRTGIELPQQLSRIPACDRAEGVGLGREPQTLLIRTDADEVHAVRAAESEALDELGEVAALGADLRDVAGAQAGQVAVVGCDHAALVDQPM